MKPKTKHKKKFWPQLDSDDWKFIDHNSIDLPSNEFLKLAAYELAREAFRRGTCGMVTLDALQRAFPGFFPVTPYIKIPPDVRKNAWETDDFALRRLIEPTHRGLTYTIRYDLEDDEAHWTQPDLLDAEDDAVREAAEKLFALPITRRPDDLVNCTTAFVNLRIDLDFDDRRLEKEFTELLDACREKGRGPAPEKQPPDPKIWLKYLGATRLWDHYETVENASNILIHQGVTDPYPGGQTGWSKAKKAVIARCAVGGRLPLQPSAE